MKTQLACLSLAALAFASCDKSETKTKPVEISSAKPRVETRTEAPTIAEKPAPAQPEAPRPKAIDRPLNHPVDASMIRPAGTAADDTSWETLTAEQKIGKFKSSGIARMPKDISDKILADVSENSAPEDQINLITRQAAAWHHINKFREEPQSIPDHMKMALLERLSTKHGESWVGMANELDEQVAASARVDELRGKGIPGLSPDESQELFIRAIEKYGPDYKAILSLAEQSAKK